jgi:cytochrome c-type biogenesis protein CcmE
MKPKHKRLTFVVIAVALLGAAVALVLVAFEDNIVFFFSPTEILERKPPPEQRLRVGGLVEEGSVDRSGGARVTFRVTDLANTVAVTYVGLLPDLFREGQGVVVEGYVENGVLRADEVLAKHDENYMPPEVAEALKKSGQWRDTQKGTEDSK